MNLTKLLTCVCLSLLLGCSRLPKEKDDFRHEIVGPNTPWNGEHFDNNEGKFTFAIFTDLTGGERERIFEVAISQLSLLRPELILSVGDLIDGASQNRDSLSLEWESFDRRAGRATAPIFYTGGNHDLTGQVLREVWLERYGKRYYHFVYKDVLFLILDTEDHTPARMEEILQARNDAIAVSLTDPDSSANMEYARMPERTTGQIGSDQANYFRRVIFENPDVRWSFLFMHKPVWMNEADPEFQSILSALGDSTFTVFNGHFHRYSYRQINGADFITLGTTGGGQSATNPMAFDHVTLVTVDEGKPSIANLRLDGILDKTGSIGAGGDSLCFQRSSVLCQ